MHLSHNSAKINLPLLENCPLPPDPATGLRRQVPAARRAVGPAPAAWMGRGFQTPQGGRQGGSPRAAGRRRGRA